METDTTKESFPRKHTPLDPTTLTENESITLTAYHLSEYLKLKPLAHKLSGKLVGSSTSELQFEYGPKSYLFVYRFGALVFVNVPAQKMEHEIQNIRTLTPRCLPIPMTESYDVRLGKSTNVEFEYAELKRITKDTLRMIGMTLGQSAALEYFETHTERMLEDSSKLIRDVSHKGNVPWQQKKLIKLIGQTASARQDILTNLAVMDAPEETWESKSLEALHRGVQDNFEIELRSKTLEKKLSLLQDNIELLAGLTSTKRGHMLEFLIVLLIVLEIFLALIGFF